MPQAMEIRRASRTTMKVIPNAKHPLLSEARPHMTEEKIRRWLVHPTAGGFPPEGPATWPRDGFTFARIRDGDVTVVEGDQGKAAPKKVGYTENKPAAAAASQPVAQPTNKPQTAEHQQR
jgi:hypothetical protein